MQMYVNGQEIDVTLEDEKTTRDVIVSFVKTCRENDAAIVEIDVDGEKISDIDTMPEIPLSEKTKISFGVVTKQDVLDTLKNLSPKFSALADKMENVSSCFQSGNEAQANSSIAELAETIGEFCNTMSVAAIFPNAINNFSVEGKTLSEFFEDFSPILSQLEDAMQSGDTVQISDMAEYEICPRLRSLSQALGGDV